ncbi:MAG: hypothetical protein JO263_11465 [Candidatus Eremiobacteraeota bacterium]|nr:hypothetical protein [Candidatus Eremiobacteraeota bacterium]
MFWNHRAALAVAATLLATSACGGSNSVPPASSAGNAMSQAIGVNPDAVDTKSILKQLRKGVIIGSTVDPTNGDTGPYSLYMAGTSLGKLKKGQFVVCNYADSSGTAGNGTTTEILDPSPGSKPTTFVQNAKIKGCDGDAISSGDYVYAAGQTSGVVAAFTNKGKYFKSYGVPLQAPSGDVDAANPGLYSAEYMFITDAKTGSIVSFSINNYGNPRETQVVSGFDVNNGTGWGVLGPSGIQYSKKLDAIYVVDGVDNTLVEITHASNLLVKDEIVVQPGGTTFKCKHPTVTCAKLIYHGAPLDGPVALTLLPNGNLIAANTIGGNRLVEIAANGQVLATKAVDKSSIAHVFGLRAVGSTDTNTVLYFTDTKTATLDLLKR